MASDSEESCSSAATHIREAREDRLRQLHDDYLADLAEEQEAGRDRGLTEWKDVCVIDLVGARSEDLNGSFGVLICWDTVSKRWQVGVDTGSLEGHKFMIKPVNLRVLTQSELRAKYPHAQRAE